MSSGVNIVGDATKAVGTGVVQGTKVEPSAVRGLNNAKLNYCVIRPSVRELSRAPRLSAAVWPQ